MKKLILFLFSFIFILHPAVGQDDKPTIEYNPKISKEYISSYWKDGKGILSSTSNWSKKDWIIGGSIVAGTAILFNFDEDIRDFSQSIRTDNSNYFVSHFLEPFGGPFYLNYSIYTIVGLYGTGWIIKDNRLKVASMNATKSLILSAVAVNLIKLTFGRSRPYTNDGYWDWFNNPLSSDHRSFASGHTVATWSVASAFAHSYPEKKWVGTLAYSVASLVGLSRIHDDKHWASDVLLGAAIGYGFGRYIAKNPNWNIQLEQVNNTLSYGLALRF